MKALTAFIIFVFITACTENLEEFTAGNNLFTAAVYKVLELSTSDRENVLVSPLSVQIVLALIKTGAKDETAQEIQHSLHLPSSEDVTKSSFKTLLTKLRESEAYKLHTANKVYVKQGLSLKNSFKQMASEVFQSGLENIDFSEANKAADTINNWVKQQTENKIRNLIDPRSLNADTALILVNTLYFKGNWVTTFEIHRTRKRNFYKSAKDIVQVDFMSSGKKYYEYFDNTDLKTKFLKMNFEGGNISMVIVLPDDIDGLPNVEKQAEKVFAPHPFQKMLVSLMLPKFKIESKTLFVEILKKLGVNKAFSKEQADFSGIAGVKGNLMIDEIFQKTFIDVNENGVEVAVATDVKMLVAASPGRKLSKHFLVDHPFMYYIKYEDVILFAGKVVFPQY